MKKKPKVIERHRDDCGDDLRGLQDTHYCPVCGEESSSSEEEEIVPLLSSDTNA